MDEELIPSNNSDAHIEEIQQAKVIDSTIIDQIDTLRLAQINQVVLLHNHSSSSNDVILQLKISEAICALSIVYHRTLAL